MKFGSLEMRYILFEKDLAGGFLDNFQKLKEGFRIRVRKSGTHDLVVKPPDILYFSQKKEDTVDPTPFCMKVRKHVKDKKISRVYQYGLDRVIVIEFQSGESLVIELFSKGNIILRENGKITACLRMERWKDRTLRPGEEYVFPKGKPEKPDFKEILSGKESLVKVLIKNISLHPKYCEEICLRAGYEKDMEAGKTDPKTIEKTFKEIVDSEYAPFKYVKDGKTIDIAPFHLKIYDDLEEVGLDSLSEAIQELSLEESKPQKKSSKFERISEKTKADLEERTKRIEEYQKAGDYIYKHYSEFKDILKNHKTDPRVKKREGKFIEVELG